MSQFKQLSGATVKLLEDGSEATDNVVQISGTPEQAERGQSLLQGFILSSMLFSLLINCNFSCFVADKLAAIIILMRCDQYAAQEDVP